MNARDELAEALGGGQIYYEPQRTLHYMKADALIAEGWRKMPAFDDLWNLIAAIRDAHPRRVDDAPTDEIVAAILALMDGGQ